MGTDHLTDVGFDTQYEFLGARDSFWAQARFITENQNLGASQALGLSTNSHGHLPGVSRVPKTIGPHRTLFQCQRQRRPVALRPDLGRQQPSESVPACMACHGENAGGNGPIPRLAGQHQAYVARQLEAFASMVRTNEIMHEN